MKTICRTSLVAALLVLPAWLAASGGNGTAPAEVEGNGHVAEAAGLRGFVCDRGGKGFSGATVFANRTKAKVAEDGTFFVPHKGLRRGGTRLIILAYGELDGKKLKCARFIDYVTGKENVTLRLEPSASLGGHIVSPEGGPVAGAMVSALMNAGGLTCHGTMPVGKPVQTDEKGRFDLDDLYPNMRYKLWIVCPGSERKITEWIAVEQRGPRDKIEVVLREAPGFVAGRVVDENGGPVPNARVILGSPCIPGAISVADAEGGFRIDNLLPGKEVTLRVGRNSHKVKVGATDLVLATQRRKKED